MDIREVEEHVKYRIANTPVREYPFPHFFVENVFPDEYYRRILELWPGEEYFRSIAETNRTSGYAERFVMSLLTLDKESDAWEARRFWQEFATWFCGPEFLRFLVTHYRSWILRGRKLPNNISLAADGMLVQDHTNYGIGPHTDAPHRLVSTLFYCPADDSQRHLGTSLYVPQSDAVPCEISGRHYARDHFVKIDTMPFIPNSMFGFVVSPNSFHGVDRLKDEGLRRNVILHIARMLNAP